MAGCKVAIPFNRLHCCPWKPTEPECHFRAPASNDDRRHLWNVSGDCFGTCKAHVAVGGIAVGVISLPRVWWMAAGSVEVMPVDIL